MLHRASANTALPLLQDLFALMHALYWSHWTSHWQTKGSPFYGDHLMFQRMYEGMKEEIDTLAEKMIAKHGGSAVDSLPHLVLVQPWLARWAQHEDLILRALQAETDFQEVVRRVYDDVKGLGGMTLGLDDFIMSTANDHETHLYLLQQRWDLGGIHTKSAGDMSAEHWFSDTPQWRETREFAESQAITNEPSVAKQVLKSDMLVESPHTLRKQVDRTPPTVSEILVETPGSEDFSTLSRFVVETEQSTDRGVPQGLSDVPRHPDMSRVAARWFQARR